MAEHQHRALGWHEITAGFRMIAAHPLLRPLGLRTVTATFFGGFLSTLYMLFAIDYLGSAPL